MEIKNIIKTLLFFSVILINGCFIISSPPEILIKKDFNGDGIAVLNFSSQGNFIPSDLGKVAADKLTDALFIEGKFNVIDRAKVNEAQVNLEIRSTEFLSADEIQKLGLKLKANYLILGRVQHISSDDYINKNSDKEIYISFRIISVMNSDVIGVATYSSGYNDNIVKEIEKMMNKIAYKIAET